MSQHFEWHASPSSRYRFPQKTCFFNLFSRTQGWILHRLDQVLLIIWICFPVLGPRHSVTLVNVFIYKMFCYGALGKWPHQSCLIYFSSICRSLILTSDNMLSKSNLWRGTGGLYWDFSAACESTAWIGVLAHSFSSASKELPLTADGDFFPPVFEIY